MDRRNNGRSSADAATGESAPGSRPSTSDSVAQLHSAAAPVANTTAGNEYSVRGVHAKARLQQLMRCSCFGCRPFQRCLERDRRGEQTDEFRYVVPNSMLQPPDAAPAFDNKRFPSNEFHRFANLYFVFIVILNWMPGIEAFARGLSLIPISFVLSVTALKDIFEDYRRHKSDMKVNASSCRVWSPSAGRYLRRQWRDVRVGDFVHVGCNEIIPADLLLVNSSDPAGLCYVETSNLDGESNLKQRHVIPVMLQRYNRRHFEPPLFQGTVHCEQPNNKITRFHGFIELSDGSRDSLNQDNVLLRGCEVRNTNYVEGLVLYAGKETKAMLNNSGPRYKRSDLERLMNWDIVWCVVILLIMCVTGAIGSMIWLAEFDDKTAFSVQFLAYAPLPGTNDTLARTVSPNQEGFLSFWTFVIILQVMIPISLYVSIEMIKLGQVYFIGQDIDLYHAESDRRIQCRALNITEQLGQIDVVLSDKTGTLTENMMIFRRCAIAGVDYGPTMKSSEMNTNTIAVGRKKETVADVVICPELQKVAYSAAVAGGLLSDSVNSSGLRKLNSDTADESNKANGRMTAAHLFSVHEFLMNMAICNTVVVNTQAHSDPMTASGYLLNETSPNSNLAAGGSSALLGRSGSELSIASSFNSDVFASSAPGNCPAPGSTAQQQQLQAGGGPANASGVSQRHVPHLPPLIEVASPPASAAHSRQASRTLSWTKNLGAVALEPVPQPVDSARAAGAKHNRKEQKQFADAVAAALAPIEEGGSKAPGAESLAPQPSTSTDTPCDQSFVGSRRDTSHSIADTVAQLNKLEEEPNVSTLGGGSKSASGSTRKLNSSRTFPQLPRPASLLNIPANATRRLVSGLSPLLRSRGLLTPRSESPTVTLNPIYEAESPDELSLVHAAAAYGVKLLKRHVNYTVVEMPDGRRLRYEVLHMLPFDSTRKRMSVMVRSAIGNAPIVYTKGADAAILSALDEEWSRTAEGERLVVLTQNYLSKYSSNGLRTLCLARRQLTHHEYSEWARLHHLAETDIDNREQLLYESALRIERKLVLLGATGIEDQLQEGVAECIAALRSGGVKVWVLTGDKIETAVNIAYACKLFAPDMELIQLSSTNEQSCGEMLELHLDRMADPPQSTSSAPWGHKHSASVGGALPSSMASRRPHHARAQSVTVPPYGAAPAAGDAVAALIELKPGNATAQCSTGQGGGGRFAGQGERKYSPDGRRRAASAKAIVVGQPAPRQPRMGLVIDGMTLGYCLTAEHADKFAAIARQCTSVLCCRSTPLQKASVAKLAKQRLHARTLAIGDGANDVSMIQCADVGVGISGQEGMQAVMASDFALARFYFLKKLLFVHGHWCYDRLARTILYFFYKNSLMVYTLFWYQLWCGFSGQVMIDQIYLMFYNLLFTSAPPLVFGIFEQPADDALLMDQPKLYAHSRLGKDYRWHSFWLLQLDSVWQSIALYGTAHLIYWDTWADLWTFGFLVTAAMVVVTQVHLAIEVQSWTLPLVGSIAVTLIGFFSFALVYHWAVTPAFGVPDLPVEVAQREMLNPLFWAHMLLIVLVALLPRFTLSALCTTCSPSSLQRARYKRRAQQRDKKHASAAVGAVPGSFRQHWRVWWNRDKSVRIAPDIIHDNAADVHVAVVDGAGQLGHGSQPAGCGALVDSTRL